MIIKSSELFVCNIASLGIINVLVIKRVTHLELPAATKRRVSDVRVGACSKRACFITLPGRVGVRREGASTELPEVILSSIKIGRCAGIWPGKSLSGHGGGLRGHASQAGRVAPSLCGGRRTHPPPWPFRYAGKFRSLRH